jgi:hypothetical protein
MKKQGKYGKSIVKQLTKLCPQFLHQKIKIDRICSG